jgi:hypothetical protein
MSHPAIVVRSVAALLALIATCSMGTAARAEDPSPCALLEPAEVEAVIGPLAGPPFRASGGLPDQAGPACRYETPAFRAVELRVEWRDGGETFGIMNMLQGVVAEGGMKGVLTLSDGTELVGEWDEARVFMCCEFNALRGEQLVVIDISGSRATVEQAATLADAALRRLDQPLAVDEAAAIAAAESREPLRPKPRPACQLLPRVEAEAVIGAPLSGEPAGDGNACTYAWTPPGEGYELQMTLNVTWRGGFSELRLTQAAMGQAFAFLEAEGLNVEQEQASSESLDEVTVNMIGVLAVKSDVMLSIETGGMGSDIARALVAKAASAL